MKIREDEIVNFLASLIKGEMPLETAEDFVQHSGDKLPDMAYEAALHYVQDVEIRGREVQFELWSRIELFDAYVSYASAEDFSVSLFFRRLAYMLHGKSDSYVTNESIVYYVKCASFLSLWTLRMEFKMDSIRVSTFEGSRLWRSKHKQSMIYESTWLDSAHHLILDISDGAAWSFWPIINRQVNRCCNGVSLSISGILQRILLAVILLFCLSSTWWRFSTEENELPRKQNPNGRILTGDKALTRQQQESKRSTLTVGGELHSRKPPVNEMPSAESRSAINAFVVRSNASSVGGVARTASDMNDVMDEMLNRSEIPADYAETMVALFRDKSQGDVIRDFAVQHVGLYAETLQMRGKYDADASESATLRAALWDAAEETRTIVAVAAFRALADMAAFDPRIDVSRLDSRLTSCVADSSASPAARVMAAQLCGERRVTSARAALEAMRVDAASPEILRQAARRALDLIDGRGISQ